MVEARSHSQEILRALIDQPLPPSPSYTIDYGGSRSGTETQTSLSPAPPGGYPKMFPDQIGYKIPPVRSGSALGSHPSETCQNTSDRRHPNQMNDSNDSPVQCEGVMALF